MQRVIMLRGSCFLAVAWFGSYPARQQVLFQSSCVSPVELSVGRGGRGLARSQIIRSRGLVLYKSFNTLWRHVLKRVFYPPPQHGGQRWNILAIPVLKIGAAASCETGIIFAEGGNLQFWRRGGGWELWSWEQGWVRHPRGLFKGPVVRDSKDLVFNPNQGMMHFSV